LQLQPTKKQDFNFVLICTAFTSLCRIFVFGRNRKIRFRPITSQITLYEYTYLSVRIPDCAGPCANSSTDMRGNLILVRTPPRTERLLSGVTGRFWRIVSASDHLRQKVSSCYHVTSRDFPIQLITRNLCYVISQFCGFPCRWHCPQGWAEQYITFFPYVVQLFNCAFFGCIPR
jgi:hypothetical protein